MGRPHTGVSCCHVTCGIFKAPCVLEWGQPCLSSYSCSQQPKRSGSVTDASTGHKLSPMNPPAVETCTNVGAAFLESLPLLDDSTAGNPLTPREPPETRVSTEHTNNRIGESSCWKVLVEIRGLKETDAELWMGLGEGHIPHHHPLRPRSSFCPGRMAQVLLHGDCWGRPLSGCGLLSAVMAFIKEKENRPYWPNTEPEGRKAGRLETSDTYLEISLHVCHTLLGRTLSPFHGWEN